MEPYPAEEYEARWRRLRMAMAREGVRGLVVTTRENVLYACGMDTNSWYGAPIVFVLPIDRMPTLVIPINELGNADAEAHCGDIRAWGSYNLHERMKIDPIEFLAGVVKDLQLTGGPLAMEWGRRSGLSVEQEHRLRAAVDCKWAAVEPIMAEARAVKSVREIACMREVCRLTCAGYECGLAAVQEGVTEDAVARVMWEEMIRHGVDLGDHGGHIILRGGPERNRCFGAVPSGKRLRVGDVVKIDGGARVRGYCCDMARYASIGELSAEQRRMYEADEAAGRAAMQALHPGNTLGEVFEEALRVLCDYGYRDLALARADTTFGHSIGVEVHEPPLLGVHSEQVVVPGMIFAVEPQLNAYAPDFQTAVFSVEDMVLVTEEGPEILTPLSRELRVVR